MSVQANSADVDTLHRLGYAQELRRRGPVRAFFELKRAGISSSLNMLWALAGALEPWPEGQHWRQVSRGDARLSLLLALDDYERRVPGAR